jgi:tetratricopeptide (TPR) repeat protein
LPLVATAAVAAAAQQSAEQPAKEPGVPLAGTDQPVGQKGDAAAQKQPVPQQPAPQPEAQQQPASQQPGSKQPPSTKPAPATQPSAGIDAAAEPHASFMEPMLAERLAEVAQYRLRERVVTEPMWRQAAALLEAATRISPAEPRFHRLLIEARLKMGDNDGAIKALSNYRKADPGDQVAQVQLIDLYAGRMQTADARLEYLRDILARSTVAPAVRSHVAAVCVPLLMERSRDEAMAMLDESLRLNPLNLDALRLRYGMMDANTPPAQRCAVLLSLLRSNPAQPDVIDELADLLSRVGLARDAIEWYSVALRLYPRLGRDYPEGFVSDVGTVLLAQGQNESLETLVSSYLKARPDDAEAWFVKLLKEKTAGGNGTPQALENARAALSQHWAAVADRIAGKEPQPAPGAAAGADAGPGGGAAQPGAGGIGDLGAAGAAPQPAQPVPDPADAVRRLKAGEAADLKAAFVNAVSDLAWLELYFAEKPDAAAKWVNALKEVLPPDSVTIARLVGWLDLLQNRPDDARAKLSAIADQDPLAALGTIRLAGPDAQAQAQADDRAAKLMADYPHGLIAAIIRTDLRGRGNVKPPVQPGSADVSAELAKFPKDWMEILNQPTAYYKVSADVPKVAHRFGEPLMGQVRISNVTDYDLTVGEGGVLRPDLWFDAKLGGLANQAFPGVAYDRISRYLVLPGRTGFYQTVRIDQGPLGQALASNPSVSTQVLASVVTNPVPVGEGVGPGPGGMRVAFKALSRAGFPLSQPSQRKRVLTALESGTPAEKIRNLDLVTAYVQLLSATKDADEATRAAGVEFANALSRGRDDATPVVAAYATYLSGRLVAPEKRGDFVERLVNNNNWPARLMGLVVAVGMTPEKQAAVMEKLAKDDADPLIKSFAAATADFLRNPPSTQPTTQPGAEPGNGAGGSGAAPAPPGVSVPSEPPAGAAKRGG